MSAFKTSLNRQITKAGSMALFAMYEASFPRRASDSEIGEPLGLKKTQVSAIRSGRTLITDIGLYVGISDHLGSGAKPVDYLYLLACGDLDAMEINYETEEARSFLVEASELIEKNSRKGKKARKPKAEA